MARYISYGPQQKDAVPEALGVDLRERAAVLLRLLADRSAVRVLCAPALYGKSVAAFQYAQLAFAREQVMWVHASDPRFLCDLDDGGFAARLQPETRLVVLDAVAEPHGTRRAALAALAQTLQNAQCELVVTTRSAAVAALFGADAVRIDAAEHLLDASEVGMCDLRSIGVSSQALARCAPPVLLDRVQGRRRFFTALATSPPASDLETAATTALILGEGRPSDLDRLLSVPSSGLAAPLASSLPHAGVRRKGVRFDAFPLTPSERLHLLQAHLDDLVAASPFESDEDYLDALARLLLESGDRALLSRLLASCFDPEARSRFCSEHGLPSDWDNLQVSGLELREPHDDDPGSWPAPDPAAPSERVGPIDVKLLGRFELSRDGKPIPDKGEVRRKARVLIALLVINHDKELPRIWVERALWPDASEERARSSFYNLWSYVRRLLADSEEGRLCLRRSRDTVSLCDLRLESDVIALDELCAAVASCEEAWECEAILRRIAELYRGPLAPGLENACLDAYRSEYQNKVLDACVQGVDFLMRRGDVRSALRFSSFAFHIDPTREDVCYQAMKSQKMLGQFAGAISTFMRCRRALVDRFGIDGSRRLDTLYEEILRETAPS